MQVPPDFVREFHAAFQASPEQTEPPAYVRQAATGHPAGADYVQLRRLFDHLSWAAGKHERFVMAADGLGDAVMRMPRLYAARKATSDSWHDGTIVDPLASAAGSGHWRDFDGKACAVWRIGLPASENLPPGLTHLALWQTEARVATGWQQHWFELSCAGSRDIARWLLSEWPDDLLVPKETLAAFADGLPGMRALPAVPDVRPGCPDAWL